MLSGSVLGCNKSTTVCLLTHWTVFLKAICPWILSNGCLQKWSFHAFEILHLVLENASEGFFPIQILIFWILRNNADAISSFGYLWVTATVLSGFHCTLDLDLSSICGLMNILKSSCFVNRLSFLRNQGYFWILSGHQNFNTSRHHLIGCQNILYGLGKRQHFFVAVSGSANRLRLRVF